MSIIPLRERTCFTRISRIASYIHARFCLRLTAHKRVLALWRALFILRSLVGNLLHTSEWTIDGVDRGNASVYF